MDDSPLTRLSLLVRLKDNRDGRAWEEFAEVYTPVVYGFVRRRGLQDADAADVTQEVFRAVARAIGGFECDRRRGSFRGWLMAVTRSKLMNFLAERRREVPGSADAAVRRQIESLPAPDAEAADWEHTYRQSVFAWAAGRVRGHFEEATWQAFWQTSVEGKGVREVAAVLGMSEGAVYVARCRVLAQLKRKIHEIEDA
ncbi:MAG: sigma-70 family RNA polymerase sigma factor [Thermoguttaceae bacterium]|jgi:RNA polymerase sigma-70 factor (ECF subfamily)|nr:sigma-70 family RNA polymerase sigma factor [Thermoguttaceae bacterium]